MTTGHMSHTSSNARNFSVTYNISPRSTVGLVFVSIENAIMSPMTRIRSLAIGAELVALDASVAKLRIRYTQNKHSHPIVVSDDKSPIDNF